MPSYQDIESRLISVEDKLEYLMQAIQAVKLVNGQPVSQNALHAYHEAKNEALAKMAAQNSRLRAADRGHSAPPTPGGDSTEPPNRAPEPHIPFAELQKRLRSTP